MKPFAGLSFQQLLLMAFLLIGTLLGASSLRAIFTLEQLMAQSRQGAAEAIRLNTAVQQLGARSQTLERAARQSLVLADAGLHRSFEEGALEAGGILRQLEADGLPHELAGRWNDYLAQVSALLGAPAALSLENERAAAALFQDIDALNAVIGQQVQDINTRRSTDLLGQLEASRREVTHQVVGVLVLALVLALALGIWLARPFKRLERAIRRLGENTLDRPIDIAGPQDVRRLGRQLEWLLVRLLELDADKARFLRHVSHELKTPLASLREGVALLQDGVTGELSAGQREVVGILHQNTLTLQSEIEALLRFNAAAFEARQLHRRDTDLLALLEEQVEAQRLQWQARRLHVSVQGEPTVLPLDADKMGPAIGNLLSNAIRFSPEGGAIRIALTHLPGCVRVDFQDEGPGVHENDRTRIFEPFYRGRHQPQDAARGTGIGLSIVQEYVNAHGGRVYVVPEGRHALLRIELPHAH